ncbi:MAG TPA: replication-associated recombination protein A [Longimicrobiaceae bacterium]|nr:replication-associated recombination protein A [Longimicrobiaceae bacterium]
MSELSLFGDGPRDDDGGPPPREPRAAGRDPTDAIVEAPEPRAKAMDPTVPLAERMRPRTLDDVVGQDHLVGPEGTLRKLVAAGHIPNLILHGPPGTGKTTLARVIAGTTRAAFVPFNAVSEGVPRLREVVKEAQLQRKAGRRTLLFVDEIHRLNKGQQDFLLPAMESGLLTLIGATTEHPAFEINSAVLSRSQVLVLEPLGEDAVRTLLRRAVADADRGLGALDLTLQPETEDVLVQSTGGDARQALTGLDVAARLAGGGGVLTPDVAREALQQRTARYDTTLAYEMLSAFHKSLRASSGEGALFWAARMLAGGEDPKTLFRRLVACAYEDVGLADPQAGVVAVQAMQAFERLGYPEGMLPLSNAILYVANAPKSNRAYLAMSAATDAAKQYPDAPVPLHLRNATTSLMREWKYGEEYKYAHNYEGGYVPMQTLPDDIKDARFYEPSDRGFEVEIARRIAERDARKDETG